jgi:hypothetical protein
MKALVISLVFLSIAGCRRERTCTCTDSSGAVVTHHTKAYKNEAKDWCEAMALGGGWISCELR